MILGLGAGIGGTVGPVTALAAGVAVKMRPGRYNIVISVETVEVKGGPNVTGIAANQGVPLVNGTQWEDVDVPAEETWYVRSAGSTGIFWAVKQS